MIMPAHVRYADRSQSRLAKRDRVAGSLPKSEPKSKLKVDAQKIEGAKKIETPQPEQPKQENPEN